MASKALSKHHAPRRPNPWAGRIAKMKQASLQAGRRAREEGIKQTGKLITVGAAAGLAYAQQNGVIPPTVMKLNTNLAIGLVLGVGVPMFMSKGGTSRTLERIGDAALVLAAAGIATGQPILGDDGFGWGVGGEGGFDWGQQG